MAFYEDNSISHDITTNAGFRAWVKMIQKALEEVGIVKTEDTGQINTETVETPAVNNTYTGYNIWRFNDSDQATEPVYFKLEYGRSGEAKIPKLRWSVGTGSNGSGTLTNAVENLTQIVENAPSEKGIIYAVFNEGELGLVAAHSLTGNFIFTISIGRARHPVTHNLMGVIHASNTNAMDPYNTPKVRFEGTWVTGIGAGAYASIIAKNIVIPGIFYLLSPVASAPYTCFIAFREGEINKTETGKVITRGKERQYKRLNLNASRALLGTVNLLVLNE